VPESNCGSWWWRNWIKKKSDSSCKIKISNETIAGIDISLRIRQTNISSHEVSIPLPKGKKLIIRKELHLPLLSCLYQGIKILILINDNAVPIYNLFPYSN